jgi:hypothetical protein
VSCNGRCWCILCPFDNFFGHLVYFMAVWYVSPNFGTFLPLLVCCAKKNLANLVKPTSENCPQASTRPRRADHSRLHSARSARLDGLQLNQPEPRQQPRPHRPDRVHRHLREPGVAARAPPHRFLRKPTRCQFNSIVCNFQLFSSVKSCFLFIFV